MSEADPKTAVHIIVHGHVQGVGFRYFVQRRALALEVVGWVRNRGDGTVEIWAEGPRTVLDSFINRVKQGPQYGLVQRLERKWDNPKGIFRSFNIHW